MNSRVEYVHEWEVLAQQAGYRAGDLAVLCHVSLRTLERHFRKHHRITIRRWLKKLRMGRAYAALREGKAVKEASFECGYKQTSHFSRDFKKHFGIPPSFLSQNPIKRVLGPRESAGGRSPQMIFTF